LYYPPQGDRARFCRFDNFHSGALRDHFDPSLCLCHRRLDRQLIAQLIFILKYSLYLNAAISTGINWKDWHTLDLEYDTRDKPCYGEAILLSDAGYTMDLNFLI
jgi:hypothetical protein